MQEEIIKELRHVGTLIISKALDYARDAGTEEDEKITAEYEFISDGLMEAAGIIQERIEEIRREEE